MGRGDLESLTPEDFGSREHDSQIHPIPKVKGELRIFFEKTARNRHFVQTLLPEYDI